MSKKKRSLFCSKESDSKAEFDEKFRKAIRTCNHPEAAILETRSKILAHLQRIAALRLEMRHTSRLVEECVLKYSDVQSEFFRCVDKVEGLFPNTFEKMSCTSNTTMQRAYECDQLLKEVMKCWDENYKNWRQLVELVDIEGQVIQRILLTLPFELTRELREWAGKEIEFLKRASDEELESYTRVG